MNEKEKKYPQLILKTDGTYTILIENDVEVSFNSVQAIEEFTKNKNFSIIGKSHQSGMVRALKGITD